MTLIVVALGWIAAIVAIAAWQAPWWTTGASIAAAAPAVYAFGGRRPLLVGLAAAALALAGGLRFDSWHSRPLPGLAAYTGQTVTIEGTIASLPDPGLTTARYELRAHRVTANGPADISGKALLTVDQYARYEPGTPVTVRGKLDEPPVLEGFDYRAYLARSDIVGTMLFPEITVTGEVSAWDRLRTLAGPRLRFERALQRSLPEPEASLAAGIAIGRDDSMPPALIEDYRATGLAHLIAVSGSNVALVTIIVFVVAVPVAGRQWATWPAIATALAYMLLAGLSPTVTRAAVMAAIALIGYVVGRPRSGLTALAVAIVVMTAISPAVALDVGFQLSAAATAGIIAYSPWIEAAIARTLRTARVDPFVPGPAVTAAALTIAATIATLPAMWTTFERVSLIGPLANVVVAPLFALAFWLSLLTGGAGMVSDTAGWTVGLVAYYPLALTNAVASRLAAVPFADVAVPGGGTNSAIAAYLALGAAGWFAYRYHPEPLPVLSRPSPAARPLQWVAAGGTAAGLVAAVLTVSILPLRGPGEIEVAMLDVGQGDAILVTTPGGTRILIDGGPSGIQLMREVGAVLPHWQRTIDVVFLTHPQQDHLGGLVEFLRRYRVGEVIDGGTSHTTATFEHYAAEAPARVTAARGDRFEWDGVTFYVLWPPRDLAGGIDPGQLNDASLVLRISYGETSFLLTGDLGSAGQNALMTVEDVRADVHKVSHHGAGTSSLAFLDAVGEVVALIPVGAGNRFGHPDEDVLTKLSDATVYRTDINGRVRVTSDGHRLRVHTER